MVALGEPLKIDLVVRVGGVEGYEGVVYEATNNFNITRDLILNESIHNYNSADAVQSALKKLADPVELDVLSALKPTVDSAPAVIVFGNPEFVMLENATVAVALLVTAYLTGK